MSSVHWIEEPGTLSGPPAVEQRQLGVGKAEWLGQAERQDGKLSTIEKIAIAGVTISAISLALNLYNIYKRSTSS